MRIASGNGPTSIVTGDLNGDSHLDVVVANGNDGTIGVYLGNGDGTFQPPSLLTLPAGSFPQAVALADLNGDGKLDLIEADYNNTSLASGGVVRVMFGNGDGTFQPAASYVAGTHLTAVVSADFNGDGKPDVAVVDNASGSVRVLLNDRTGQLEAPVSYPTGVGSYDLAAVDLAKTGKLDLVISDFCKLNPEDPFGCIGSAGTANTTISVLLGNGDGTFRAATAYPADALPFKMTIGDFNGDGFPDVAASTNNGVTVLLGQGDGSFAPFVVTPVVPSSFFRGIVSGDFNSDSKTDLMSDLTEFVGNGDGSFEAAITYSVNLLSTFGVLHVADLNEDGHADILARTTASSVGVFLNAFGQNRQGTTVTAIATPSPGIIDSNTTITAAVSTDGLAKPGGRVNFYASQAETGSFRQVAIGTLDSTGHSSGVFQVNSPGTYNLAVIYAGDGSTQGSISPVFQQQVNPLPTSTSLSSNANPSTVVQAVILTASVFGTNGQLGSEPSGTVAFFDGPNSLGTAALIPIPETIGESQATLTLSNLGVGLHSITATYQGDANFAPSASSVLVQRVINAVPLTITTTSGSTSTINAGDIAAYSLSLQVGALSGSVIFSCAGAPANSGCSVNPPMASVAEGDIVQFTVVVVTQARSTADGVAPSDPSKILPLTTVFLLAILVLLISVEHAARDRRRVSLALILVGAGASSLAIGCGGSGPSAKGTGTPAGSYTIVVSATSGQNAATQNLMLVVK